MPQLSVIICSHNPRIAYLNRVLDALRTQTLPKSEWELLVVDNASREPIASGINLGWHCASRHLSEPALGLTRARLCGMSAAAGDLLVFVDDDNVLNPGYLETALRLSAEHPSLGAIGGAIIPEYESTPPDWLHAYERVLAIRRPERARWSNAEDDWQSQPWGAGMIVRRAVCRTYLSSLDSNQDRRDLDRKGGSLLSGGDTDLVLTSLDLGLGFGVFPELQVTHLIPPERMTEEYVARITRALTASSFYLAHLRGRPTSPPSKRTFYGELRSVYHFARRTARDRLFESAVQAGYDDYCAIVRVPRQPPD